MATAAFFAVAVTVVLAAVASEAPNAYSTQAEFGPIPTTPMTWLESLKAVAMATGMAVGVGLLAAGSVGFRRFAIAGQLPRRRHVVAIATTPPVAVLVVLALVLVANRGDARLPPDCATFAFDPAAFRSTDRNRWQPQAIGLHDCRLLIGRRGTQIDQMLSKQDPLQPGQPRDKQLYHDASFELTFYRGRVLEVTFGAG